jgi:hypothetical protein
MESSAKKKKKKYEQVVIINYIPKTDYPSIKNDHQGFDGRLLIKYYSGEEQTFIYVRARACIGKLEKMRRDGEDEKR